MSVQRLNNFFPGSKEVLEILAETRRTNIKSPHNLDSLIQGIKDQGEEPPTKGQLLIILRLLNELGLTKDREYIGKNRDNIEITAHGLQVVYGF